MWVARSAKIFGSAGMIAHLVYTYGPGGRFKTDKTLCGVKVSNRTVWRKNDKKPKCPACKAKEGSA